MSYQPRGAWKVEGPSLLVPATAADDVLIEAAAYTFLAVGVGVADAPHGVILHSSAQP